MDRFNVLISSGGRRVSLLEAFRDALRDLNLTGSVFVADASSLSSAARRADRSFVVPRCDTADFVPELIKICSSSDVHLVVPTIDPELEPYADSRERFAAIGTTVAVSSPETVRLVADKSRTFDWLVRNSFPTLPQSTVADVVADRSAWRLPVVVKPRRGSASNGVRRIKSWGHLKHLDGDDIVQPLADGDEYTVDVLVNSSGRAVCAVPRRRLEVRAGEVSKALTVRSPALEHLACSIAETLPGAYGALNIQMFWDSSSDDIRVLEINARFGGGFPLSWRAGGLYPRWIVEDALSLPSSSSSDLWQDGLLMLRYDEAVFLERPLQ